ncbi:response regulator [Planctomycetes bacterium K23_9]|uniref:Acetoacetate metabolism regulatory protein AtoC n=1 Tax=Stieleria marina TaxID=1930275 RepID=A0A517P0H3_9BACT|nr:acetoacetate metabolism regulatory protein AtoC [Planctomycetes bacterium K23_9]
MKKFDSGHADSAAASSKSSAAVSKAEPRKSASIIVVDPNPLSLIATAGVMDYQGYGVICARTGQAAIDAFSMGHQDLVLWDVGDDAADALSHLEMMRQKTGYEDLPAVLVAESQWAGLEKKAEAMAAPTRCLFKPIDPNSLIAVVHQVLFMPSLVKAHRKRGSRPSQSGWVSL